MLSDDLTGTVDCVSLACGCKEPVPTMVCADGNVEILPRTKAREIVAVNLSSRTIPGKEAYQRTYDAAVKVRDYPLPCTATSMPPDRSSASPPSPGTTS